jgi:HAD superfamily hydrolase (TIGR01484 family)
MSSVLVFDLDGTLAQVGKGMLYNDINKLCCLEKKGFTIVICSGKPSYYLCGFLRQIGLKKPVLIGENGGTFQFGIDLPPKRYYEYSCTSLAKQQLKKLRNRIDKKCGNRVWYQPNQIGVTPFPKDERTFEEIQEIVEHYQDEMTELIVYRHIDSYDITPNNINKANGMKFLSELLQKGPEEFVAIGDGVNDIPMFDFSHTSISVGRGLNIKQIYVSIQFLKY